MNSPFEVDVHVAWRRDQLLGEAESERLARKVPRPPRTPVRARLAAALYALADWLSADAPAIASSGIVWRRI